MIKKIIYSLVAIVLVALISTIKPSFVSADENSTDLVIETHIDDTDYDVSDIGIGLKLTITAANGELYSGDITYEVTGTDLNNGTITVENGKTSLSVMGANNVVKIKGLPEGSRYEVSVSNPSLGIFDVTTSNATGIIGKDSNHVKVNEIINTYDLEFIMHISGVYDDFEIPVHFHANTNERSPLPREPLKYELIRDGKIIENGVTDLPPSRYYYLIDKIWLKDGDRLIIKDVATVSGVGFVGNTIYNYEFGELFLEKYGISINKILQTSTIPDSYIFDDQEKRVLHLNFNATFASALVISKQIASRGVEKDKEFMFKVRGYVQSIIKDDLEHPITGNYPYVKKKSITEPDPKDPSKMIVKTEIVETGSLEFDKNGVSYIKLKANEGIVIGENPEYYDENGEPNDSYNFFKAKIIKLINHCFPSNAKFEVTEINEDGYNVEIDENRQYYGSINYIIKNTRKFTGKLTINKKVSGNEADKNKEFNFKIKLEDGADDIPMTYKYTGSKEGELEFDENFEAAITLKDGESITIEGLPVGAKYIVEEDDYSEEGYTTTVVGGTGTIKDGDTETVTASFTNHKGVDTIEDVPKTDDKIGSWLITMIISILGIITTLFILKRRYLKA